MRAEGRAGGGRWLAEVLVVMAGDGLWVYYVVTVFFRASTDFPLLAAP